MATDAEKAFGEIMGQQHEFATLLAKLMIKYAPEFFEDRENKKAEETQKKEEEMKALARKERRKERCKDAAEAQSPAAPCRRAESGKSGVKG